MTSYRVRTASSALTGRSDRKKQTPSRGRSGIRLSLLLALLCHTGIPDNASGAILANTYSSNETLNNEDYANGTLFNNFNVTINPGYTVNTGTETKINIKWTKTFTINGILNNNGSLSSNPFPSYGIINIGSSGTLNNAGTVTNNFTFTNNGTLTSKGALTNDYVVPDRKRLYFDNLTIRSRSITDY